MRDTLAVLGVLPPVDETYASWMVRSLTMIACALLWTACLFLGPLVTARFDGRLVDLLTGRDTLSVSPWIWWRNMVVVWENTITSAECCRHVSLSLSCPLRDTQAPAGEEFVFRCCNVVLWQHAGISTNAIVFLSPLLFAAGMPKCIERTCRLQASS